MRGCGGPPARQSQLSRFVGFEGYGVPETWGCQGRRGSVGNKRQGGEPGGQNPPALSRARRSPVNCLGDLVLVRLRKASVGISLPHRAIKLENHLGGGCGKTCSRGDSPLEASE